MVEESGAAAYVEDKLTAGGGPLGYEDYGTF